MVRKISLALVLMTMAGVASARHDHDVDRHGDRRDKCEHILWFDACPPSSAPAPVKAPEFNPASAMAGLTLLAGGLAVLRGRRRANPQE